MRYIVNDHFVLILFMLIGVGSITYLNFVETLEYGMYEPRVLLLFLYFVLTFSGSVTLFLEPADQVFLIPKEQDFRKELKKLVTNSYLQSLITIGLMTFITFPILVATLHVQPTDSIYIFLTLAGLKWLGMELKLSQFFYSGQDITETRRIKWFIHGGQLFTLLNLLFLNSKIIGFLLIGLAVFTIYLFYAEKFIFENQLNWEAMIDSEEQRMQRVYRFIQMFVNVPHMETRIHRLPWLDKILEWFAARYQEAPYYFIIHTIVRNTEYSLLVIRVALVGCLLIAVTDNFVISALLLVLFLYLIGFQLITLVKEIERTPQFQIYPITNEVKIISVSRLISEVLTIVTVLLTISSLNELGLEGFLLLVVGLLFSYAFSHMYTPRRIKNLTS